MQFFHDVAEFAPNFLAGFYQTVLLWAASLAIATALGLFVTAVIWLKTPILARVFGAYVLVIRCIPILLQVFYIFFLLPSIGIELSAFWSAAIGLGLAFSAYMAEVFRAGILAVDKGPVEAATSLAMPPLLIARRIVLPQAVKTSLPGYSNLAVTVMKMTSVASVIGVPEITRIANMLISSTYKSLPIYCMAALYYLALTVPLMQAIRRLER